MNVTAEHLNNDQIDQFWHEQNEQCGKLGRLETESPEEVYGLEIWNKAFAKKPTKVVCVDERVHISDPEEPEICIAGTLVLMNPDQRKKTITKLKLHNADGVTFHEGCGACALFKAAHPEDPRSVLQIARDTAREVAKELDSEDLDRVGFSEKADIPMEGIPDFHHARIIIVDGSGRFNPAILGIKDPFQSSIYYHPDREYTASEIEVMLDIAMGDHGFGTDRFAQDPLLILVVGHETDPEYSLDSILANYQESLEKYGNKVKIVTVMAPSK